MALFCSINKIYLVGAYYQHNLILCSQVKIIFFIMNNFYIDSVIVLYEVYCERETDQGSCYTGEGDMREWGLTVKKPTVSL